MDNMKKINERGVLPMRKKQTDERVAAEINRIYKAGYLILSIGIGADIFLQGLISPTSITIRPLEILVFFLAQAVCLVMMVRRGFADDNQYAEADVFPLRHTLKTGALIGLVCGALGAAIRLYQFGAGMDGVTMALIAGSMIVFTTLLAAAGMLLAQYVLFRLAKRRREKLRQDDEE